VFVGVLVVDKPVEAALIPEVVTTRTVGVKVLVEVAVAA